MSLSFPERHLKKSSVELRGKGQRNAHAGSRDSRWNFWRLLLPLIYMTGIFFLSSIPDTGNPVTEAEKVLVWIKPGLQNLLHIPLFGGLALCWHLALKTWSRPLRHRVLLAFCFSMLYAVADELHQLGVPGRYASVLDLGTNLLGISAVLGYILSRDRRKKT